MKRNLLILGLVLLSGLAAQATLYPYTWNSGFDAGTGVIPDGNPAGWTDTRTLDAGDFGTDLKITDVNVRLEITGGYNGDLYGYLVHASGFAVLLNRVGRTATDSFGYGDAGFDLTLGVSGTDIHTYGGNGGAQLTGNWLEDGRNVNPATVVDTDSRGALLSSFNTLDPSGTWTLFLADLAGGNTSTLVSWGLDIEAVPEPTTWALVVFGGLAGLGWGVRRWRAGGIGLPAAAAVQAGGRA